MNFIRINCRRGNGNHVPPYRQRVPIKYRRFVAMGVLLFVGIVSGNTLAAEPRQLIDNPSFENTLLPWSVFHRSGSLAQTIFDKKQNLVIVERETRGDRAGVFQRITLNQHRPTPVTLSGASLADNIQMQGVDPKSYYLKAIVLFNDGVRDDCVIPFNPFQHGWQRVSKTYYPDRPIQEVVVYAMFDEYVGRALFDDVSLCEEVAIGVQPLNHSNGSEDVTAVQSSLAPSPASSNCVLRVEGSRVALENQFIRIVFDASRGAGCDEFVYKPYPTAFAGSGDYRMFTDRVREAGKTVRSAPFEFTVISDSGENVSVQFARMGLNNFPHLEMRKTVTVRSGQCGIEIDYDFINHAPDNAPIVISPHFRHGLTVSGRDFSYFIPKESGVERVPSSSGGDVFHRDVTRGWLAAADTAGIGLACEFDYRYVDSAYNWIAGAEFCTLEWWFAPIEIKAGEQFHTQCRMTPFHGVRDVAGVENGFIGQTLSSSNTVNTTVYSARSGLFNVRIMQGAGNVDPDDAVFDQDIAFTAGEPRTFASPSEGVQNIRCAVSENGERLALFEDTFEGKQHMLPRTEQVKAATDTSKDVTLSTRIKTPHVKWGIPYERGRLRALGIVGIEKARELVELAQRLDIDIETVRLSNAEFCVRMGMMSHYGSFTYRDANRSLQKRLEEDYDVLIVSGPLWSKIDAPNQALIEAKLAQGMGLILITPQDLPPFLAKTAALVPDISPGQRGRVGQPRMQWRTNGTHYITCGIPVEILPATYNDLYRSVGRVIIDAGKDPLAAVVDGTTRIVAFAYQSTGTSAYGHSLTPAFPYHEAPATYNAHEYYFSLLAKSVLWAAQKTPTVLLEEFVAPNREVEFSATNKDAITSRWNNLGPARTLRTEVVFRDCDSDIQHVVREERSWAQGINMLTIPCPERLRPGLNLVDIRILHGDKVVNWGSTWFNVSFPASIQAVTPDETVLAAGEKLSGTVRVDGDWRKTKIVVRLKDASGAAVRQAVFEGTETCRFSFDVPAGISVVCDLEATVFIEDRLLDREVAEITITPPPHSWDDFIGIIAGDHYRYFYPTYLLDHCFEVMRECGFSGYRFVNTPIEVIRRYIRGGAQHLIVSGRGSQQHLGASFREAAKKYSETRDVKYLVRDPCLADPEFLSNVETSLHQAIHPYLRLRPLVWRLGDENSLTYYDAAFDFCFSKWSLDAFRVWLQEQYGSLPELNNEWATDFESWEDVIPSTTEGIQQRGTQNYAPWADHREYMDTAFADYFALCREACREAAPGISVAISGTQMPGAYSGYDYWKLSQALPSQIQPYKVGNQWDLVASFGVEDVTPWCAGYGSQGPQLERDVWEASFLFRAPGISFFSDFMALNPDLTLSRSLSDYKEYTEDLRRGVGRLIRIANPSPPDVLIHYSQASLRLAAIQGRTGDFQKTRNSWVQICRDSGLSYGFVSYQQIEDGWLSESSPAVLVLPDSMALSDLEAKRIAEYVSAGGVLLCDREPGTFDRHCAIRQKGVLTPLLGVSRAATGEGQNAMIRVGDTTIHALIPNKDIKEAGARAQGVSQNDDLPVAVFVHDVDQGQSVFLNFLLDYAALKEYDAAAASRYLAIIKTIIRCDPAISVERTAPGELLNARAFRYQLGDALYLGVVNDRDTLRGVSPLRVRIPQKRHVYDVREQRYLGYLDEFGLETGASQAAFYAMTPWTCQEVSMHVSAKKLVPGQTVDYEISVVYEGDTPPSLDVVRLDVYDERGTLNLRASQNLTVESQIQRGDLQIPYNTPAGTWKIVATHVISGRRAEAHLEIVSNTQ